MYVESPGWLRFKKDPENEKVSFIIKIKYLIYNDL